MVSQILFGEPFEVVRVRKNWARIRCGWDNYEGWIDVKQYHDISEEEYIDTLNKPSYSLELVEPVMASDHFIPVLIGSNLPAYDGVNLRLNSTKYTYSGQVINPSESKDNLNLLIKIVRKYLYAPYLWGGRSPFGIDCSGLVQSVFKMIGINLPRDAYQQVKEGELVSFVEEVQPGDLAFFQNDAGRVTHVGIMMDDQKIIHASGRVRIDRLDHYGIYNESTKKYSHQLRVIKRLLPDLRVHTGGSGEKEEMESNSL